eukprot:758158_1
MDAHVKKYEQIQIEFEEQYLRDQPFTEDITTINGDTCSAKTELCMDEIDSRIINILNQFTKANISTVTALREMTFLIFAATFIINETSPDVEERIILNYHHLLYHFAIYSCCLGKEYTQFMVLPQHYDRYEDNKPLKHWFDIILQTMIRDKPNTNQYKHELDNTRNTIIIEVAKCLDLRSMDIAHLIADFTDFKFANGFFFATEWIGLASATHQDTKGYPDSFSELYKLGIQDMMFVPKLLMSSRFISIKDSNFEYFANQVILSAGVKYSDPTATKDLSVAISKIFRDELSTHCQPWMDWVFLAELFEQWLPKFLNTSDINTATLFAQCIDDTNDLWVDWVPGLQTPLSVFYNGNNETCFDAHLEYKTVKKIYDNIDGLFSGFINKYCIGNENTIRQLSKQMVNSIRYFERMQIKCIRQKKQLMLLNALLKRLQAYHYFMVQSIKPISEPPYKRARLSYNMFGGPLCARRECAGYINCFIYCYE